ncbi:MAG: hypothetical protein JXA21_22030 [Anaerolineae bacterium]|nr:hypothetical protein [Anaerolineae bacterium]
MMEQEIFEPKTKAQHREEKLTEFRNWQDKVDSKGGGIIQSQGRTMDGVQLMTYKTGCLSIRKRVPIVVPHGFYMLTMSVRASAPLSTNDPARDRKVEVRYSAAGFYGLESRGEDDYYVYEIRTIDTIADSLVKAQELLWQLECHKQEYGFYMVPVVRKGVPCWLPLTQSQFYRWQRDLEITVSNFEKLGFTYENEKNNQERLELERREPDIDGLYEEWARPIPGRSDDE